MSLARLGGALTLGVLCCGGLLWAERVRLPDGTLVRVRLKADLNSVQVVPGDRVDLAVARAVTVRGLVAIPEGSAAWGTVQSVKKGKEIKFNIEGVRLPSRAQARLRAVREKATDPGKNQIKVETQRAGWVGAPQGTEFIAFLDENVEVEALVAQGDSRATPGGAPVPATLPAPVKTDAPIPTAAQAASPAAPAVQDLAAPERVTVECFSEPSGAEIVIDGNYYGNTPSILKLTPTRHQLELQMPGYKTSAQGLNLAENQGLRTIRAVLEKKE